MTKSVLVTGGAGFIGSHIVDSLLLGGRKVVVIDNLSTGCEENLNLAATFYCGSITNKEYLKKIFVQHNIDLVIHGAAIINEGTHSEIPNLDVAVSIEGTLNLLDLSVKHKVERFIYVSSVSVYGRPTLLPAKEESALAPINSYGIAKLSAEEYVKYFWTKYGLPYHILRYGNIYGPRQPRIGEVGVISVFTQRVVNRLPLIIYGDGSQMRDFLYVDDCVEMTLAMSKLSGNHIVNIASGFGVSVNGIFDCFSFLSEFPVVRCFEPFSQDEVGKFYSSIESYKKLSGLQPGVKLMEGIRKTLTHFINR